MALTAPVLAGLLLLVPVSSLAHGLVAEVQSSVHAVVVSCAYSGGGPAEAEVLVYSPREPGSLYQRQHTDLRGLASFVPDVPGVWRVVVDDGLGHRADLQVSIQEGQAVALTGNGFPRGTHLVALVALLMAVIVISPLVGGRWAWQ